MSEESQEIEEWELLEEIYKISTDERNYQISLNPIEIRDIRDTKLEG
ncbi:MAG: hypothetical protein AABY22_01670 [Nanoarchaeota archaeon]